MDIEEILNEIDENEEYLKDTDYSLDEEYEEGLRRGIYLNTVIIIIEDIKDNLVKTINEEDIGVNQGDVFEFLKHNDIFEEDYTNLHSKISETLTEMDYGQRYFLDDEETFKEIKEEIENLYDEYRYLAEE